MTEMHDLVGAYAVDALDDDQREAFERHLAACSACVEELADFREVLASVADTQAVVPPADVWKAVARTIGEPDALDQTTSATTEPGTLGAEQTEAGQVGQTDSRQTESGALASGELDSARQRRRRPRPALSWLAAAAVAAVLFAGGVMVGRQSMPEVSASADPNVVAALEVAAAGDAFFADVDMMGSHSTVVTSGEMDKSVFLASDLPTPAKGLCYQVWSVNDDGSKTSAGVFLPDEQGHVAVVLDGGADVSSYVITLEPPGGSKTPTGQMVAQVAA